MVHSSQEDLIADFVERNLLISMERKISSPDEDVAMIIIYRFSATVATPPFYALDAGRLRSLESWHRIS